MSDVAGTAAPAVANGAGTQPVGAPLAGQAAEGAQPAAAAPKKWKLPIDGGEEELDEQQMIESARLGRSSWKRFEEASKLRKEADSKLAPFKDRKQFIKALEDQGLSRAEIIEEFEDFYDREVVTPSKMTEEQRSIRDLQAKLKAFEDKETENQKKTQEQQATERHDQFVTHWEKNIMKAIDSTPGLPKNERTVSRIAYYAQENLWNKTGLSMEQIAARVKDDFRADLAGSAGGLDGEKLVAYLGEDNAKKVAQYYAQKLRERRMPAPPRRDAPVADDTPRERVPEDKRFSPRFSKNWIPVVD